MFGINPPPQKKKLPFRLQCSNVKRVIHKRASIPNIHGKPSFCRMKTQTALFYLNSRVLQLKVTVSQSLFAKSGRAKQNQFWMGEILNSISHCLFWTSFYAVGKSTEPEHLTNRGSAILATSAWAGSTGSSIMLDQNESGTQTTQPCLPTGREEAGRKTTSVFCQGLQNLNHRAVI